MRSFIESFAYIPCIFGFPSCKISRTNSSFFSIQCLFFYSQLSISLAYSSLEMNGLSTDRIINSPQNKHSEAINSSNSCFTCCFRVIAGAPGYKRVERWKVVWVATDCYGVGWGKMGHPLVSRNTRKITADFNAEEKFRVYSSFNTYIKLKLGGVK